MLTEYLFVLQSSSFPKGASFGTFGELRDWYNGRTSVFQTEDKGSIPLSRTSIGYNWLTPNEEIYFGVPRQDPVPNPGGPPPPPPPYPGEDDDEDPPPGKDPPKPN